MEEQMQISDISNYCRPSSSELCNQSIAKSSVEGGVELINCNVNDDDDEIHKVVDESRITYQRKKRKSTELSDSPTSDEFLRQESCSPSGSMDQRVKRTCLDQSVEFDSENVSDKRVITEDKISLEVDEMKSLEEISFQKTCSGNCDSLGGDAPMYHEEQSVASKAGRSLKPLDDTKGVAPPFVHNESINVAADRIFTGKKLLVLDVNGLLVHISPYVPYDYDPDDIILKKAVFKRPHCDDFIKFCFESFNVGVWTSRTKSNIEPILDFLLGNDKHKLLFCWDQSHCTNTGFTSVEKRHKPLLLKKLNKLWNKCDPNLPWEWGVYNESNTLLLDDTPYKALSNPRYTAVFPYTYHFKDVGDNSLGPGGDLRIYLEGLAIADNVQEYVKQNPFGQRAITEKNLSWGYYRKVMEASSTPPRKTQEDDDALRQTL